MLKERPSPEEAGSPYHPAQSRAAYLDPGRRLCRRCLVNISERESVSQGEAVG